MENYSLIIQIVFVAILTRVCGAEERMIEAPSCPSALTCVGCKNVKQEWDNGTHTGLHCHCDQACSLYKDCCADYVQYCGNHTRPEAIGERMECIRLNKSAPGMMMVTSCPESYTDQKVIEMCLISTRQNRTMTSANYMDELPVVDIFQNRVFRNRHCATCNGYLRVFIAFFDLKIRCDLNPPQGFNQTQILDYYLRYCKDIYMGLPGNNQQRFCFPSISTCPANASRKQREACENNPTALVFDPETKLDYKNKYCLECNGASTATMKCGPMQTTSNFFKPKSFEILMSFIASENDEMKIQRSTFATTCIKNYMYDAYLEVCRPAVSLDPTKGVSDKYWLRLWLTPTNTSVPFHLTEDTFTKALAARFNLRTPQIDIRDFKLEDPTVSVSFDLHASKTGPSNEEVTVRGRAPREVSLPIRALLHFNGSFLLTADGREWEVFKATARRLTCVKPEEYAPGEYKFQPWNEMVVINKTGETLSRREYYMTRDNHSIPIDMSTVFVCRSLFSVGCSHVMLALRPGEFTIFPNKSLLYRGQQYPEEEYLLEGDTPWVCTNETSHLSRNYTVTNETTASRRPESGHVTSRRYLTIIGLSLSVFCLFLVLIAHVILPDLRKPLPGKNLMSLSMSLFLAHFWYLFASGETDKPAFCKAAAVTLHYLFLVTFGCTAVVAYDTRRTFSQKIAKAHAMGTAHHTLRLVVYLLLSWGLPCVLVGISFALDWYHVVTIGYGEGEACWLGDVDAQLVAFAAPVGVVLVFNIVAFSQTIFAINNARKQTTTVKGSHTARPSTVKIYIRLTSLMGFSWFFGISATLIHHALMYPFVVMTTLQGVYIFLAFICKARVLRMFKEKLPLRKAQPAHSNTKRGTTVTTDMRSSAPYAEYKGEDETRM